MSRSRILLVDDHERFLSVGAGFLEGEFDLVATARDGHAAIEAVSRLSPDVVILDISMPGLSGIETARRMTATGSPVKIVFLTVHDDPEYVREGFAAGAVGYVLKSRLAADLVFALREALAGNSFVSPTLRGE